MSTFKTNVLMMLADFSTGETKEERWGLFGIRRLPSCTTFAVAFFLCEVYQVTCSKTTNLRLWDYRILEGYRTQNINMQHFTIAEIISTIKKLNEHRTLVVEFIPSWSAI